MQRGLKFQGGLVSTHGRHYELNFMYFNVEHFYFWRPALFAGPCNRNGNQDGPILCKSVHEEVRGRRLELHNQHTFFLLEAYWWHICHMGTRWEKLKYLLYELNSFHSTIQFTTEWSKEFVMFLNTEVINNEGCLITDLHIKPMDTHQYLHCNSCHLPHCKKALPTVKPYG